MKSIPYAFTPVPTAAVDAAQRGAITQEFLAFITVISRAWYEAGMPLRGGKPAPVAVPPKAFTYGGSIREGFRILAEMKRIGIIAKESEGHTRRYEVVNSAFADLPKYKPRPQKPTALGTKKPPEIAPESQPETPRNAAECQICHFTPFQVVDSEGSVKFTTEPVNAAPDVPVPLGEVVDEVVSDEPVQLQYLPETRRLVIVARNGARAYSPPPAKQTHPIDDHIEGLRGLVKRVLKHDLDERFVHDLKKDAGPNLRAWVRFRELAMEKFPEGTLNTVGLLRDLARQARRERP